MRQLHEHQRIVAKMAALYAATPEDREDLFQEILQALWRAYPTFRGEASFATWAYRVALNTALLGRRHAGAARRAGAPLGQEALEAAAAPSRPDALETREGMALLHACIRELQPVERALVMLHLEGRSHAEIAAVLGLSSGNVGVRLHRVKQDLRERLRAHGYDEEATS